MKSEFEEPFERWPKKEAGRILKLIKIVRHQAEIIEKKDKALKSILELKLKGSSQDLTDIAFIRLIANEGLNISLEAHLSDASRMKEEK